MAHLKHKALFFTTSPRTPYKMIPEIRLLHEQFAGHLWNKSTQENFMDKLAESDFFAGTGSLNDKAFSARDRINRAPKALGFVDLKPTVSLTAAGHALVFGKHPQEIFLRQLLKFQLPSPYHIENKAISGTFFVRPYLEIMRLLRELEYITFDELKIFAIQLTDYRKFDAIKTAIVNFRNNKNSHKGEYKKFVHDVWTDAILTIFSDEITSGKTKTRETKDASLKKFITTKKSNLRDYADACFRYLRYTGLVSISHRNKTISFFDNKLTEVDYFLTTVERKPIYINSPSEYKAYLFDENIPALYVDIKDNIVDTIMRISDYTKQDLTNKVIDDLKDLRDKITQQHKDSVIRAEVTAIKSYALYSEIIDTYNEIISDQYYDAPLMFEYNTWRAMTMLDNGDIRGNFNVDDAGKPMSTAQGNMPDIECDYGDFVLSVEVTLQRGQRQYESEGEPVARHYGQLKQRKGKEAFCLFIAPTINPAALMHFFALNQINNQYYGGKTQIIPLDLDQFMLLIENAYNSERFPTPADVKQFLVSAINKMGTSIDENDWSEHIQNCVSQWLVA